MKLLKKFGVTSLAMVAFSAMSPTAFGASNYNTPAEAVAGLTGRDVQSVIIERQTGKTYGTIANEAGVLDEFKIEVLEIKKDILATRVTNGTITQEQADASIKAMEDRQADCDGTGQGGRYMGAGQGNGQGQGGRGMGAGQGNGQGQGGRGMGLRDGSCV